MTTMTPNAPPATATPTRSIGPPPTPKRAMPRRGFGAWLRVHKLLAATISVFTAVALAVAAVVTIRQDVTTTPAAKAPDVIFENGADYTGINTAGYATLTIGSSGTSATLAISGVAGAVQTSITKLLKLTDTSSTVPYTVTLARSAALDSHITSFVVTVKNGGTTLATWDAASAASSSSFTLPVSTSLDVNVVLFVADGTSTGSLGSFGMQFTLAP
jgi:hypothetical protein